jgi:hypothetical protein
MIHPTCLCRTLTPIQACRSLFSKIDALARKVASFVASFFTWLFHQVWNVVSPTPKADKIYCKHQTLKEMTSILGYPPDIKTSTILAEVPYRSATEWHAELKKFIIKSGEVLPNDEMTPLCDLQKRALIDLFNKVYEGKQPTDILTDVVVDALVQGNEVVEAVSKDEAARLWANYLSPLYAMPSTADLRLLYLKCLYYANESSPFDLDLFRPYLAAMITSTKHCDDVQVKAGRLAVAEFAVRGCSESLRLTFRGMFESASLDILEEFFAQSQSNESALVPHYLLSHCPRLWGRTTPARDEELGEGLSYTDLATLKYRVPSPEKGQRPLGYTLHYQGRITNQPTIDLTAEEQDDLIRPLITQLCSAENILPILFAKINHRLAHSNYFQTLFYDFLYKATNNEDCLFLEDGSSVSDASLCFPKGHLHKHQVTWKGFLEFLRNLSLYPNEPTRTVIEKHSSSQPRSQPKNSKGDPYTPNVIYIESNSDHGAKKHVYKDPKELLANILTHYLQTGVLVLPHRRSYAENLPSETRSSLWRLDVVEYIPIQSSLGLTMSLDNFQSVCAKSRLHNNEIVTTSQLPTLWEALNEMEQGALGQIS